MRRLLGIGLLLLPCTCASWDADVKRIRDSQFASWRTEVQLAVDRGQLLEGMTKDQVQVATGIAAYAIPPDLDVNSDCWLLCRRSSGQWENYECLGSWVRLRFSHGRLEAIEEIGYPPTCR